MLVEMLVVMLVVMMVSILVRKIGCTGPSAAAGDPARPEAGPIAVKLAFALFPPHAIGLDAAAQHACNRL